MVASVPSANDRNTGFSTGIGANEARRQLRMSVGVVVLLAISIVSAAVSVGGHTLPAKRDLVSIAPVTALHAETDAIGAKPI